MKRAAIVSALLVCAALALLALLALLDAASSSGANRPGRDCRRVRCRIPETGSPRDARRRGTRLDLGDGEGYR